MLHSKWTAAVGAWVALSILATIATPACNGDACGSGFGDASECAEEGDPASELNGGLEGSYTLDDPDVDESIDVASDEPGGYEEASPGGTLNVSFTFDAPNANVVGGGIRFGTTGPVTVVEIPDAMGQTSGTINFAVEIPDSVCDDLSQICHDIKCYEFAVTSAGKISKSNINDVALKCGNCDEPSCKGLLDSCNLSSGCDELCNEICPQGGCPSLCAVECPKLCACTEDQTGSPGIVPSCCGVAGLDPSPDSCECPAMP